MRGRVLIVAGSDSGGGAGIQADIKTVSMLDAYAATAITALTAQNTEGVFGVLPIPPEFIRRQIEVVLDDIGADVVKTGMLHDAPVIEAIVAVLQERGSSIPVVVDPVMVAKGGARLIDPAAVEALKQLLITRAEIVTPNLPEAEILCGAMIGDVAEMRAAGEALLALGCRAALIKGGHLSGETVSDVLVTAAGVRVWESPRIATRHTHGTAAPSPRRSPPASRRVATSRAPLTAPATYVHRAIAGAPGLGRGHGPLDHAHPLRSDLGIEWLRQAAPANGSSLEPRVARLRSTSAKSSRY